MKYGLRQLELSEAPELFRLMEDNRNRLIRYFPLTMAKTSSYEDTRSFLKKAEELSKAKEEYLMGVHVDGKLMGMFFIKTIDWRVPKCELAYFIDKELEGKGITYIFMSKVLEYCFQQLEMQKIFLLIGLENERSKRLAEKAGFQLEGVHRKDYRTGEGDLVDLAHYALYDRS